LFEQARPHAPQLLGSLAMLASHPFTDKPSQSTYPALQVMPHTLLAQVATALGRDGQAMPQPPQLLGSLVVGMQALPQKL
jgi:hypothetical protein